MAMAAVFTGLVLTVTAVQLPAAVADEKLPAPRTQERERPRSADVQRPRGQDTERPRGQDDQRPLDEDTERPNRQGSLG
jgi:hypothetical protein